MGINQNKKVCIYGIGGFGREVLCCIIDSIKGTSIAIEDIACFMVDDEYFIEDKILGINVIPFSKFNASALNVVVAIGNPELRKKMVEKLPPNTSFATIIHPNVVMSKWVEIGEGSVITAGSILTCNIKIGKHAHLNLQTTIGHDCVIGDYFTSAPSVNISGNCTLGECVYLGTKAATREKINICDRVTIGMGGIVLKDITEAGTYIGSPVKKLNR
jgi:sugar O-acyltransferase (sialic acid O-acetyltransferase NeuD family)